MKDFLSGLCMTALVSLPGIAANPQAVVPSPERQSVVSKSAKEKQPFRSQQRVTESAAGREKQSVLTRVIPMPSFKANRFCVVPAPVYQPRELFTLPFYDDFSDGDATRINYTVIDVNSDGFEEDGYTYNRWYWKEDEQLMQFCVAQDKEADDWLMTPAIYLDGKNIYNLEFVINMGATSNLEVTVGKSTDPADHISIYDLNSVNEGWMAGFNTDFSVSEAGEYYIGFHQYSAPDSWYFNLFSISVQAGMSSDMPKAPESLSVLPAENGELKATLRFHAPELYANGQALPDPMDIEIMRNDVKVAELTAAPGAEVEWTDESPVNGENKYSVYAVADGSEGLPAEVSAWIGVDVPQSPKLTTIKAVDNNMHVYLEWEAPTAGMHNGYFNPESVTYTVWRGYDSNYMSAIATDLTTTSFTDTSIESLVDDFQDAYFYAVSAVNEAGSGNTAAEIVAIGAPYTFPNHESFAYGQLTIEPWLTDPIEGSFSWECMKYDSQFQMSAQDDDNGFMRFYSYWGGETDSRLVSPVFTLKDTENPAIGLWMFHWDEASVWSDYGATKLIMEISVDGGDFMPLGDAIPAGYHTYGWVEHRFPLNAYKDAETVQFGIRGQTDNSWMYFFVDNITFDEMVDNDLTITSFYGSPTVKVNEVGSYAVTVYNRGLNVAENYTVELYRDGVLEASAHGNALQPGESDTFILLSEFNATAAGKEFEIQAKVVFPDDEYADNDASKIVTTDVINSKYPVVTDLAGEIDNSGNVSLSWMAPVLPGKEPVVDGAEDYEPFEISGFGDWQTLDLDEAYSGYYTHMPSWPHQGENQAFQIWAPDYVDGFTPEAYPDIYEDFLPYEGDKCFISWLAVMSDWWSEPQNNDYLISPEITGGTTLKFMIKPIEISSPDETYEIMYSATGTEADDFIVLEQRVASGSWTEVSVELPEDARYFAIHYTGIFQMGLMIDNISYVPVEASLVLEGYDVFRDGVKLNEAPVTATEFYGADQPAGEHHYQVAAVYDRGTSDACDGITLSVATGVGDIDAVSGCRVITAKNVLSVLTSAPTALTVYTADGKEIVNETISGNFSVTLNHGIYIVKAGEKTCKVIL